MKKNLVAVCLENSEYLLKSSKILFKNKLYGPSLSLAALSIEECGKAFMMNIYLDLKNPSRFPKQMRSHKQKIDTVSGIEFMSELVRQGIFTKERPLKSIDEYYTKLAQHLKDGNQVVLNLLIENALYKMLPRLKNSGFYIDVDEKGKLLLPRKTKRRFASLVIRRAEKILYEFRQELE